VKVREHVNRIAEVTINVSDLDRSRAFYEAVTPLRLLRRTQTPVQAFASLGVPRGRFVGYLMADASSATPGVVVHLVQWLEPEPIGRAYPAFFHRGLYRLCFLTNHLASRYENALAQGHTPFRPPQGHGSPVPGGTEGLSFVCPDPDGVAVQTTKRPSPWRDDLADQLYHVNIVTSQVDVSRSFLQDIIGLDYVKRLTLPAPVGPIGFGRGADEGQFDAAFLWHRGDQRFSVDVVDWFVPGVTGAPYPSPLNVGIQRLAFEVDDLDAAAAALLQQLPEPLRASVRGPEVWDLGAGLTKRLLTFCDHDGVSYEFVEQLPFEAARTTPWPPEAFDADPARADNTP
jgi:catechol 2,3-dioxygenase-like lactoylglutathione lyase family enzyme